ncbi:MAG: glycosyltransferase, partial [Bacillota bacterium]|nr:glycosyltransferase [Bacillota bacterium]
DGPQRRELETLAAGLGFSSSVRFYGRRPWREVLWRWMREADLFILPSLSEGMPLVLLEAMAQGLPVAATAVGGIPELITHERTGLLVPPGDATALASALRRLLADEGLRHSLSRAGLKVAEKNTFERQSGRVADLVARLALARLGNGGFQAETV